MPRRGTRRSAAASPCTQAARRERRVRLVVATPFRIADSESTNWEFRPHEENSAKSLYPGRLAYQSPATRPLRAILPPCPAWVFSTICVYVIISPSSFPYLEPHPQMTAPSSDYQPLLSTGVWLTGATAVLVGWYGVTEDSSLAWALALEL